MTNMKFLRCEGCGNFTVFLGEKTACTPKCCGETMKLLEPNTTDAAVEKHVPEVTVGEGRVEVQVGSTVHPMLEEHHIEFICLETEKGFQIAYLTPGEEPRAVFLTQDRPVAVYEYCNLHGLWVKEI